MIDIDKLNFEKMDGLIPAIIIDKKTNSVLMLGFMNKVSLNQTLISGKVTFYSRSKKRLWTKGETSGDFLYVEDIYSDCDSDTLLIYAVPTGNTCHLGNYSCFENIKKENLNFLFDLFSLIQSRKNELPENSYTTKLFNDGENRIIQKVGEEAVETVIAAKNNDKEEIINEVSDLIFHLFVMLVEKEIDLNQIIQNLSKRHSEKSKK
ncbi:MAG: bifunctional phosphoribosyl-AMP cyclohydrolase/phosphoribosyl-ATP diphosphatase [Ignavibacteriales bacterium CG_4_9_14_3_um_filter_34_10]|nr:MAG: bifunctional phosphoribosyl-AMP cyclohydrolase/phosphoribosyl-ATP diphosphatase [Ignavibacteriales bacterium CG_4_9_14_3_um_filter_34_10]